MLSPGVTSSSKPRPRDVGPFKPNAWDAPPLGHRLCGWSPARRRRCGATDVLDAPGRTSASPAVDTADIAQGAAPVVDPADIAGRSAGMVDTADIAQGAAPAVDTADIAGRSAGGRYGGHCRPPAPAWSIRRTSPRAQRRHGRYGGHGRPRHRHGRYRGHRRGRSPGMVDTADIFRRRSTGMVDMADIAGRSAGLVDTADIVRGRGPVFPGAGCDPRGHLGAALGRAPIV